MGALIFWLRVGLLLALVLLAARAIDRRDRRRGHYLRSSGEMSSDAWEPRRDAVGGGSPGHRTAPPNWTAHSINDNCRSHRPDEPEA
jgi:hypothetical protein